MAKEFTQHSGIPEVIQKFRVIFGQSEESEASKQMGVESWELYNAVLPCAEVMHYSNF